MPDKFIEFNGERLRLALSRYHIDDSMALRLYCEDGEPYATITVYLLPYIGENRAYVDTNNCPWAEELIEKYKLGAPTGDTLRSGYCVYPQYEFDMEMIAQYAGR